MAHFIFNMIDRVAAIAGAFLFSQAPMFIYQYMQNLSGHVAELKTQIGALYSISAFTGKSLPEYIAKFLNHSDSDFAAQGKWMHELLDRYQTMSTSLTALQDATLWSRPFVFIRHGDLNVMEQTYGEFTPGLPFSLEGLVYAFTGMLVFSAVVWSLKSVMRIFVLPTFRQIFQRKGTKTQREGMKNSH